MISRKAVDEFVRMGKTNFSSQVQAKIDALKLSPDEIKVLSDDYIKNIDFRKAIDEESDLLDAWYIMSSNENYRVSIDDLQKIKTYLKEPYQEIQDAGGSFTLELDKVKRGLEAATANRGIQNYIDSNPHFVSGTTIRSGRSYKSITPDFDLLKNIEDYLTKNTLIKFSTGGKNYQLKNLKPEHLPFGYAGVITPDGKVAFILSVRLNDLEASAELFNITDQKLVTGMSRRNIIQNGFPNFLDREFDVDIGTLGNRNGSHDFGQTILKDQIQDDLLWAFALNPKPGVQNTIELGFVSGQVNRGNGLQPFDSNLSRSENRPSSILNRTDQKKVIEYLKKIPELKGYLLVLKNSSNGNRLYW